MTNTLPSSIPCTRPPEAKAAPTVTAIHGSELVDDYAWLRDRSDPEVMEYLASENAYTESQMAHTTDLQKSIYQEVVGRIKQTDQSAPVRVDDYLYYSRTEEGREYSIYCRKHGSMEAPEEVVLDANTLARSHRHFRLGTLKVSTNHKYLAYSTDTTGSESCILRIKTIETGRSFAEEIPETHYSVEWANDSKHIYYTRLDGSGRPESLYRHVLGTDPAADRMLYREDDKAFSLYLTKAKSKEYIFLNVCSSTTSEVHYLSAREPLGDLRLLAPREYGHKYEVEHRGEKFYIVSNQNAPNFKLLEAPVSNPAKPNWQELIPNREDVKLEAVELFARHMVLYELEGGLKKIRVQELAGRRVMREVVFPEPVYTYWRTGNPDFNARVLRFNYTSLVTPRCVLDYDMTTGNCELKKRLEVMNGYDQAHYHSERLFARSADGVKVPISIVYKGKLFSDGSRPALLHGYGAYGVSSETYFTPDRLSLLDRGFVYAIAHVRGGSEMGRAWYEAGKHRSKKNTFADFLACAEYLVREGYTSSERLAITGSSAGGLLIGTVINMRPHLFKAAIAKVPFVDVVNTMLDSSLPLTAREIEEWGDPHEREDYEYIKSYSPYENVQAQEYPHLLVTASLNDQRVPYWEAAKWVAKVRALGTGRRRVLLKTYFDAGHGGISGRYNSLRETAFEYAFLIDVLSSQIRRRSRTGDPARPLSDTRGTKRCLPAGVNSGQATIETNLK